MSDAALKRVEACTDPKVKGGVRALYKAIATHIPEGETTTPPMTLNDLAQTAQHTARTAQTCRNVLEALSLVKVHDGGRGNKARYELLALDGARPIEAAPLPLLGPAKPRRAKEQRSTSDLFSYVEEPADEETAINVGSLFLRFATVLTNVGNFFLCCRAPYDRIAKNVGSFFLRWRDRAIKRRSTSDPTFTAHIDRARDVGVVERSGVGGDARAREPADDFLEWFESTYPTLHHGAACTVRRSRDGPLVRELLQRPRTDVAHLQAMTTLLWSITTDGVKNSDRWWIAEVVAVRGIVVLHRKADFLDQEVRRAGVPSVATGLDADNVAAYATLFREAIEARVTRHDLFTWIYPLVVVPEADRVVLCAPSEMHATFLQKNFGQALEAATQTAFGCAAEVIVRTPARGVGRNSG